VIAFAKKRLQINYQMSSYDMPRITDNSSAIALQTCYQLNATIRVINEQAGQELPEMNCDNFFMQGLLDCLSRPSTWTLRNDKIFFPLGWTSEENNLPESDANEINEGIYGTRDFASSLQFWCLIVAGICGTLIGCLLLQWMIMISESDKSFIVYRNYKYQHEPLLEGKVE
jgi:hypothetical protein